MYTHRRRLISKRLNRLLKNRRKKLLSNSSAMQKVIVDYLKEHPEFQNFNFSTLNDQKQPIEEEKKQSKAVNKKLGSADQQSEQLQEEKQMYDEQDQDFESMSISDYYQTLTKAEKRQFRQENPDLPETFFMTKQQKIKYFKKIDNDFKGKLAKAPQRQAGKNNHIKFKDEFSYKAFNENNRVTLIKNAKETHENYDNEIHFS